MKSGTNFLPIHMQNMNGRLGMSEKTSASIKSNNFRERGFLDPISSFNNRKDFWVDPKNAKRAKIEKALERENLRGRKQNLTFN
jgi:hypothetical protein